MTRADAQTQTDMPNTISKTPNTIHRGGIQMFLKSNASRLGLLMLTLAMGLMLAVVPAYAQSTDDTDTVAFNGFRFSYPRWLASTFVINHKPGDPVEYGPGFADAAATYFTLYDPFPPQGQFDMKGTVRLYDVKELARYPFLQAQLDQLQKLLKERPDLAQFEEVRDNVAQNALPYVPVLPHGQIIRARAQFVETEHVRGISYVAATAADLAPLMTSDLYFTFQGVSADGRYYISATIPFITTLFPTQLPSDYDPARFFEQSKSYFTEAVKKLNAATSDQFRPAMTTLEGIVKSMAFDK